MVKSDTAARTHGNNVTGTGRVLGAIRRLTVDDIRVAISYREEADNREYCANVGVVILLVVNVIAFATLFFHVVAQ